MIDRWSTLPTWSAVTEAEKELTGLAPEQQKKKISKSVSRSNKLACKKDVGMVKISRMSF